MTTLPGVGDQVRIIPLDELGTVRSMFCDTSLEWIIRVERSSDGEIHLCRLQELGPI